MNLYTCGYPITFPSSEYGGLIVAIAKSPKALGKMLTERYGDQSGFKLDIAIKHVKTLTLDPSKNYQEGIFEEFLT